MASISALTSQTMSTSVTAPNQKKSWTGDEIYHEMFVTPWYEDHNRQSAFEEFIRARSISANILDCCRTFSDMTSCFRVTLITQRKFVESIEKDQFDQTQIDTIRHGFQKAREAFEIHEKVQEKIADAKKNDKPLTLADGATYHGDLDGWMSKWLLAEEMREKYEKERIRKQRYENQAALAADHAARYPNSIYSQSDKKAGDMSSKIKAAMSAKKINLQQLISQTGVKRNLMEQLVAGAPVQPLRPIDKANIERTLGIKL